MTTLMPLCCSIPFLSVLVYPLWLVLALGQQTRAASSSSQHPPTVGRTMPIWAKCLPRVGGASADRPLVWSSATMNTPFK